MNVWIVVAGSAGGLADIVLLFALVKMAKRFNRLELWWLVLGVFVTPVIAGTALLMCGDASPKENISETLKENQAAFRKEFASLKEFLRIRLSIDPGSVDTRELDESIQTDTDLLVDDSDL